MDSHSRLFGRFRAMFADHERALCATAMAQSTRRAAPDLRRLYTAPQAVTDPNRPGAAPVASATPVAPEAVPAHGAG